MAVGDYTYDEDKMRLRINCLGCLYGASIEDFPICMSRTMDKLMQVKKVNDIVLARTREYEYDYEQVKLLLEIADVIEYIMKERIVQKASRLSEKHRNCYPEIGFKMQKMLLELMRSDPIGAYVEIKREIRKIRTRLKGPLPRNFTNFFTEYLALLEEVRDRLERTAMIREVKPFLAGYHIGERALYRELFMPNVRPNFMLTRYMIMPPEGGRSMARYNVGDTKIEIFKLHDNAQFFYHALPPEFRLSEDHYEILDAARRYMAENRPSTTEFVRSERIREMFYNIGKDMVRDTAENMGHRLTEKETERLANILTRYTAGMGVLELLLADEKIQDIYINSPIERQNIMVFHEEFQECSTNLIPSMEDAEAWATRLRIQSGRPLDEANPVLDTNLTIPGGNARFAVITRTLSPEGLGFAIRRHRDKPWTLPLFMKNKMIDPLTAGLLSFLVDGSVSMLVAGGRSSGKTSMLGALMLEILPKTRIVTIEDSVTGDCEIVYKKHGTLRRSTVGELIDGIINKYGKSELGRDVVKGNPENIEIFSMDKEGKVVLREPSRFIRHKVKKDIYEVETRTGRKIKVTGDHSLFTLSEGGDIKPIECRKIKEGDYLVTPRVLASPNKRMPNMSLIDYLDKLPGSLLTGNPIREVILQNKEKCLALAKKHGYFAVSQWKGACKWWRDKGVLPSKIAAELLRDGIKIPTHGVKLKFSASSSSIPVEILLSEKVNDLFGSSIKTKKSKKNKINAYSVEEIRNVEEHKRFIRNFLDRIEGKNNKEKKKDEKKN